MGKIADNIREIKEDIKKYSKEPKNVKLVAVTKYSGHDDMKEAFEAGNMIIGENRVQVIKEKKEYFDTTDYQDDIEWHFIGNLQKNKVKYIIDYVEMVHSINKVSLAKEIDKRAKQIGRKVDVLLEVNVSNEESKEGCSVEELYNNLEELKTFKNINIKGLMTMAPFVNDESIVREVFKNLRVLKDELNSSHFNNTLTELSMGMTNDYKIALEEGATIIRVGSKIFS